MECFFSSAAGYRANNLLFLSLYPYAATCPELSVFLDFPLNLHTKFLKEQGKDFFFSPSSGDGFVFISEENRLFLIRRMNKIEITNKENITTGKVFFSIKYTSEIKHSEQ